MPDVFQSHDDQQCDDSQSSPEPAESVVRFEPRASIISMRTKKVVGKKTCLQVVYIVPNDWFSWNDTYLRYSKSLYHISVSHCFYSDFYLSEPSHSENWKKARIWNTWTENWSASELHTNVLLKSTSATSARILRRNRRIGVNVCSILSRSCHPSSRTANSNSMLTANKPLQKFFLQDGRQYRSVTMTKFEFASWTRVHKRKSSLFSACTRVGLPDILLTVEYSHFGGSKKRDKRWIKQLILSQVSKIIRGK